MRSACSWKNTFFNGGKMKHIFAVSAYKDSPYLEACIRSLLSQSVRSDILIATSTPSEYISSIAEKYGIPLLIREGRPGIAEDWNFAYDHAQADLVTIAHQDDMYARDYTKNLLEAKRRYPDMSLFTSASMTVREGRLKKLGEVELIKRMLRLPLSFPCLNHLHCIKRLSISLGNPIICPSCAYDKKLCGSGIFSPAYSFVLDWELLWRLAKKRGRWICVERPLILYRVHQGAATKQSIVSRVRQEEESCMFDRLLPRPLSALIKLLYRRSYGAYS